MLAGVTVLFVLDQADVVVGLVSSFGSEFLSNGFGSSTTPLRVVQPLFRQPATVQ